VDEKVYKGSLSSKGVAYRLGKAVEGWVYGGSDAIVSLTDRALEEIRRFPCFHKRDLPPLETIPTCVDTAAFAWKERAFCPPFVFGYIGSLGPGYLPEAVFRYFALARRHFPGSRLHLITRTEPQRLWTLAADNDIPREEIELRSVGPEKVAVELNGIDVGLSFIQPHFAKLASCPTKVGEYLAAGIPVVSNAGIGDLDRLIGQGEVGCIVQGFTETDFAGSLSVIEGLNRDSEIGSRCRRRAEESFSLRDGVARYGNLYRRLLDGTQGEPS
jgi:glycosyltransferase involved in cell wall biosynthesis